MAIALTKRPLPSIGEQPDSNALPSAPGSVPETRNKDTRLEAGAAPERFLPKGEEVYGLMKKVRDPITGVEHLEPVEKNSKPEQK